jgi:hypothetical protein
MQQDLKYVCKSIEGAQGFFTEAWFLLSKSQSWQLGATIALYIHTYIHTYVYMYVCMYVFIRLLTHCILLRNNIIPKYLVEQTSMLSKASLFVHMPIQ